MMSVVMDKESGFSEQDIHFARQTFHRDCPNGRCSKEKFLTFIRRSQKPVGLNISPIKLCQNYRQSKKFFSMMFDVYDRNKDGELDFEEYLYALSAISGANRARTIETLFSFFDVNNQGYITREEFNARKKLATRFLGNSKSGVQDTLLYDQAFNEMDLNKDGQICREDFIQWHLEDHLLATGPKPMRKRTRLLRNFTTLVESRDLIKASSLQDEQQNSIDLSSEKPKHDNNNQELTSTGHVDRYFLTIFRHARVRFHLGRSTMSDDESDSGVFTTSSRTTCATEVSDSTSFLDIDENDFPEILSDHSDSELSSQSLEVDLLETSSELLEHTKQLTGSNNDEENLIFTRL